MVFMWMTISYYLPALVLIALEAYLIGGINASIIVTKLFDNGNDIRNAGSGNAGFTNVLRTKSKKLAIATFVIDFLKGVAAIMIARVLFSHFCPDNLSMSSVYFYEYLACLCCALGHIFPCFFKFKGGKAILTVWSSMLLINWRIFLILIAVFLIVLLLTKTVSLASISAAVSYPLSVFICYYFTDYIVFYDSLRLFIPTVISLIMSCLVIYKHRSNIKRIIKGEEFAVLSHNEES